MSNDSRAAIAVDTDRRALRLHRCDDTGCEMTTAQTIQADLDRLRDEMASSAFDESEKRDIAAAIDRLEAALKEVEV